MQMPRLTVRRLMVIVAISAVAMMAERVLFFSVAEMVSSGPEEGYLLHEAVGIWVVVNVLIAAYVAMIAAANRGG